MGCADLNWALLARRGWALPEQVGLDNHASGFRIGDHLISRVVELMRRAVALLFALRSHGLQLSHRPNLEINESAFVLPVAAGCDCDFRQLECLPEPSCMAAALAQKGARVAEGLAIRKAMRNNMKWTGAEDDQYTGVVPVGKSAQYGNIVAWKSWMIFGNMSSGFGGSSYSFIDPTRYPFCLHRGLRGRACAFKQFASEDNLGEVETFVEDKVGKAEILAGQRSDLQTAVTDFIKHRQHNVIMEQAQVSPMFYFMSFAHVSRMRFNLRPSLEEVYKQRLVELNPGLGKLSVSLHIRRADSCRNVWNGQGFATSKSTIDSSPQISTVRLCYATGVYMEELRRVARMYGKPLTVFLSTDAGNVLMDEIKAYHTDVFNVFTWRYLDYTADTFRYVMVEESASVAQQSALVGESAILDLWHISHGEVFVGHLGSRFGKMGYVLAVARHNSPLPYVSVDGRNLCCETDEQCEEAISKMHGMVDCLGYAHEQLGETNIDYMKVGSTTRWSLGDR